MGAIMMHMTHMTQTKGIYEEWIVDRILVLQMRSSLCKRNIMFYKGMDFI